MEVRARRWAIYRRAGQGHIGRLPSVLAAVGEV